MQSTPSTYGRSLDSPINVCGVAGELEYLSSLLTVAEMPILFHRLGSTGIPGLHPIDRYEIVSADGSFWDTLVFNAYSSINDRRIPTGYCKSAPDNRLKRYLGSLNFPEQLHYRIEESAGTNLRIRDFPEKVAWSELMGAEVTKEEVYRYFGFRR